LVMYFELLGGFVVLLLGGDFLVRGAVALAEKLCVSPLVIGLTVVALGTSMPELMVSVKAVLHDAPGIAIGNVVGSNIANVLLVLGVPAIIFPITASGASLNRDNLVMVGASLLFIAFCWAGTLVAWQGALFVILLGGFIFHTYWSAPKSGVTPTDSEDLDGVSGAPHGLAVSLGMIGLGLAGLLLGASLLVDGAVAVAREAGVSETVIGLTMIALGTSLPELTTTIIAAFRRHGEVAIGNVIGSNLFNILGVMGVTSLLMPVPVSPEILNFDLWIMLGASALLIPFAFFHLPIGRFVGIVFTTAYVFYIWSQFAPHSLKSMGLPS
jgi:cation:H+ antiporter